MYANSICLRCCDVVRNEIKDLFRRVNFCSAAFGGVASVDRAFIMRSREVINAMQVILGLGEKVEHTIFGQVNSALGASFAINSKYMFFTIHSYVKFDPSIFSKFQLV